MRIGLYFVIFLVSFYAAGCDFLYRLLDKKGAEEKDLIGEALPFVKNPTIEEIQVLLDIYGYDPGRIDGVLGGKTRRAVDKFQKDNNLTQTRFVDKETWEKLTVFERNKLIVDQGLNIALIQTCLKNAGFDLGTIDGKLGARTKLAIKKFQQAHGLKPDEKVGYKTLTELAKYLPSY